MQQQKQQPARYDLLAVFPDEAKAETASAKLLKEGFTDEEVYHMPASTASGGEFRVHGPSQNRSEIFLQTQRSGPRPLVVVLFALVFAVVLGGLTFAATFALPTLPEPLTLIVGIAVGLVLGAIIGLLQRGRVRGAIGQTAKAAPAVTSKAASALTVVALRFDDPENISRKSRARAILLNNQGKIDRSIGRRE